MGGTLGGRLKKTESEIGSVNFFPTVASSLASKIVCVKYYIGGDSRWQIGKGLDIVNLHKNLTYVIILGQTSLVKAVPSYNYIRLQVTTFIA